MRPQRVIGKQERTAARARSLRFTVSRKNQLHFKHAQNRAFKSREYFRLNHQKEREK